MTLVVQLHTMIIFAQGKDSFFEICSAHTRAGIITVCVCVCVCVCV